MPNKNRSLPELIKIRIMLFVFVKQSVAFPIYYLCKGKSKTAQKPAGGEGEGGRGLVWIPRATKNKK
jgi:hypothetical protein